MNSFGGKMPKFDVSKASILDEAKRLEWNNPAQIVANVEIAPGSRVAEIGCGTGWFTYEIEKVVRPRGMVYALDTQKAMLQILETKRQNYERILTLPCSENEFDLDSGEVDVVFHANVLHECSEPVKHLEEANRVLKNGGRLIVIEWKMDADESLPGPSPESRLTAERTSNIMEKAGFSISSMREVGPYHYAVFGFKK